MIFSLPNTIWCVSLGIEDKNSQRRGWYYKQNHLCFVWCSKKCDVRTWVPNSSIYCLWIFWSPDQEESGEMARIPVQPLLWGSPFYTWTADFYKQVPPFTCSFPKVQSEKKKKKNRRKIEFYHSCSQILTVRIIWGLLTHSLLNFPPREFALKGLEESRKHILIFSLYKINKNRAKAIVQQ